MIHHTTKTTNVQMTCNCIDFSQTLYFFSSVFYSLSLNVDYRLKFLNLRVTIYILRYCYFQSFWSFFYCQAPQIIFYFCHKYFPALYGEDELVLPDFAHFWSWSNVLCNATGFTFHVLQRCILSAILIAIQRPCFCILIPCESDLIWME